ncbi:TIGR03557 family F420-dependent LLM class oxidoreductase [Agromyces sp. LHK192]|uniref:TIGR03557 family F420-dependent LLM class oxidoreductase n=1 Tax=Agromyces sp. LHK192 TaxID=2498704 RepID=UPI000FDA86A6|nr:TIGR03557 family F420-dependent LLM class oxidoreductase [Agromyces sp. LHK192]
MPAHIGYAAMLERFPPAEAVELSALAEANGFTGVMASDHFQPWLPAQGESSFVWSVLAAIGASTTGDLGPGVTTPGFRMHPAVVAQASATLAAMYPGRHWLGIGSGEAINEHVVGQYWPEPPERIERMFEAVDLVKRLFAASIAGRDVRFSGQFFKLESTRLWTMPDSAPEVLVAAGGPVTARRAGRVADGLITMGAPVDRLAALLQRFSEGARESGRDPERMPRVLQLHLAWAPTDEEAMREALREWPIAGLRAPRGDIRSPYDLEHFARTVRPEDFAGRLIVGADLDRHRAGIQRYLDLGFDRIYLHNVGRDQRAFVEAFGREVLPGLRR